MQAGVLWSKVWILPVWIVRVGTGKKWDDVVQFTDGKGFLEQASEVEASVSALGTYYIFTTLLSEEKKEIL